MGYHFSCKAESAIAVCDPYNWDRKKKKKKNQQQHRRQNIRKFSFSELESATGGFSSASFLGKGSHGTVYRAVIDGGNLIAAVKKTTIAGKASVVQDYNANNSPADNEIEILSRIRSHRLVNLLGYCHDPKEKKLLVVEFMPNGSLYDLLHSSPRPPGWSKRVRFSLQTAKAVETLHSSNPPVIHRDIKSSNVLLDRNWNARLGDFGLALRGNVEDVRIRSTPPAGTLGYLDPGYIAPENLSTKSDVFSFGILLLEIISGRNAIDMNYSPPSVVDWALPLIHEGNFSLLCDPRIGLPDDASVVRKLALLAAGCVAANAEKRPAMAEVVGCLRDACKLVNSSACSYIRWRITKPSPLLGAQVFDAEVELDVVKSSRNGSRNSSMKSRKASSVQPIMDFGFDSNAPVRRRAGRSKSIGSVIEMKMESDGDFSVNQRRRSGMIVRRSSVRLNKSKSMGVMQAKRLEHNGDSGLVFQLVRNPYHGGSDDSKTLVTVDEVPHKKVIEKKRNSYLGGSDDSRPLIGVDEVPEKMVIEKKQNSYLGGSDEWRPLTSVDEVPHKKVIEKKQNSYLGGFDDSRPLIGVDEVSEKKVIEKKQNSYLGGSDEWRPLTSVDEVPHKKVIEKKQNSYLGGSHDSRPLIGVDEVPEKKVMEKKQKPYLGGSDGSRSLISVDKIRQKKLTQMKRSI
ncbi:hypothetical protein NE237_023385 [Protea cynaroides]|uniref:Protein kinase domain-containing protein n=1 Tax=Protea cynaroides TaxID=273540 RepID=A0A9Q0HDV2_9MAGN|nr:hypothetical protein NE237_023385 [Protea cynaroides]